MCYDVPSESNISILGLLYTNLLYCLPITSRSQVNTDFYPVSGVFQRTMLSAGIAGFHRGSD